MNVNPHAALVPQIAQAVADAAQGEDVFDRLSDQRAGPGPMDPIPGHEESLKALTTCIIKLLEGSSRFRFTEAQKLCAMAHSLSQMQAERLTEFAGQDGQGNGYGIVANGGFPHLVHPQRPLAMPGFGGFGAVDQNEVLRNLTQAVGPNLQIQGEQGKSAIAKTEAEELETLMKVLAATVETDRRALLNARIKRLFESMEARNKATNMKEEKEDEANAKAPLVPADVPR